MPEERLQVVHLHICAERHDDHRDDAEDENPRADARVLIAQLDFTGDEISHFSSQSTDHFVDLHSVHLDWLQSLLRN